MYGLNQAVNNAGDSNQPIVLDYSICLTQDLVVPPNIQLIVQRNGLINLCGHQLTIQGTFEAGFFQVFEYSQPKHSFKETEHVIFKARSVERVISTWFGTHPDNEDNSSPLQRAIDSAYAICKIFIPSGIYRIKDTIHLQKFNRVGQKNFNPFQQFILEGASRTGSATILDGTADRQFNIPATKLEFVASDKNRPLINIQFGIGTILRDLLLEGGLSKAREEGRNGKRPNRDYWIESPDLVGRHNPYCAIATDAYVAHPTVSNSDQAYATDAAKGVVYAASGSGSQDILLERVATFNFGVGVAIAPGSAAQNDAIYLNQCRFDGCTYGLAVGSTQARGCHISNSSFYRAFAAITTIDFGTGVGSLINLTSNQYKDCRMLYRLTPRYTGPCRISGDYCENVVRLGNFGLITSQNLFVSAIEFHGCNYNFENAEVEGFGTLGLIVNNSMLLNFQGCSFQSKSFAVKKKADDTQSPEDSSANSGAEEGGLSLISELNLLSMAPNFSKFIFDGCSFRFPIADASDNIQTNALLQGPPIRIMPYPNPYLFNRARNDISFRDCVVWASGSPAAIQLSDALPVYLSDITPRRVPIHWSTRSIHVSGGTYGSQTLAIRNTLRGDDPNRVVSLPVIKVNSISVDRAAAGTGYHRTLLIEATDEADLQVGDRLFWFSRFDFNEGDYIDLRPRYSVEQITTDLYPIPVPVFVVTHLKGDADANKEFWVAEVPADTFGNTPRIPYRDEIFPLDVTETETGKPDSYRKLEYRGKAIIMPRSDFRTSENSQYYVILNGSVQGQFEDGEVRVTNVTNIDLLQIGDFVNQDYVPSGTRIKSIDAANQTIDLTRAATIPNRAGSTSAVDHIPFCYTVPSQK